MHYCNTTGAGHLLGVSKTPTRGGGRVRFFFCDLFGTRFLLDEKVSVGLQRNPFKEITKQMELRK